MARKKEKRNITRPRSVTFDVRPVDDATWEAAMALIKNYRATCRKLGHMAYNASCAGSRMEEKDGELRLIPDGAKSKEILSILFGKTGKAHLYELVPLASENLSAYRSDFAHSAVRAVSTWFRGKDGEIKATKEFLVDQGKRRPPLFDEIGVPFRGPNDEKHMSRVEGHSFFLSWAAKQEAEFKLTGPGGRCDTGRYWIFKMIRDGRYKAGTITLKEDGGRIRLLVTYELPEKQSAVAKANGEPRGEGAERAMEVAFSTDPREFIACQLADGHKVSRVVVSKGAMVELDDVRKESISALAAMSQIDQLAKQSEYYDAQKRSCGNRHARRRGEGSPAGFRANAERLGRITARRENVGKLWNHIWSSKLVDVARRWDCRKIIIYGPPAQLDARSPLATQGLLGRPWQWANFKFDVEYKAMDEAISVEFREPASIEEVKREVEGMVESGKPAGTTGA